MYNLIWLGRWLERAENVARVVNASATAVREGNDIRLPAVPGQVAIEDPARSLSALLNEHKASSIYHSMYTARSNATQVGTVELIRAISGVVEKLESDRPASDSPEEAERLTGDVLEGLDEIYKIIDDSWFHREPLSEEEVYRRFVQQ